MSMNEAQLKQILDSVLKSRGYEKRRTTWYRRYSEVVLVINLQKSDYGGQYYVNLGVCLGALNPADYPREEHCHSRARLDDVLKNIAGTRAVLDLENDSITDERRRLQITNGIQRAAEWLETISTKDALIQKLSTEEFLRNRTTVQAKNFLKGG